VLHRRHGVGRLSIRPEEIPMTSSPVKMTLRFFVPLGESRPITDALHRIMVTARAQVGCIGCSLTTDAGRQVGVRYVEEWASEEHLRRELQSERFCNLAALMESATEPPQIEFTLPSGTRGIDYVQEVRTVSRL
jgi:quinol monooxygenase YgiN